MTELLLTGGSCSLRDRADEPPPRGQPARPGLEWVIMTPQDYRAPATTESAVALLAEHGARARALAGGTDLLVQARRGDVEVDLFIDVKRIPELSSIRFDSASGLSVGGAVPCADVANHPSVAEHYPALADAASLIGGTAINGRASVGGNVCNAAPSADTIPVLMVLDAVCVIEGPSGRRSVAAADFCVAPRRTVLQPGELLVSIDVPPPQARSGGRYLRFIPRGEMDIAVVGVACMIRLDAAGSTIADASVALAAVGPTPIPVPGAARVLVGAAPTEEVFQRAGLAAREAALPITDVRGTAALRRHLCDVLVRRALRDALRRARGEVVHG